MARRQHIYILDQANRKITECVQADPDQGITHEEIKLDINNQIRLYLSGLSSVNDAATDIENI